MRVQGAVHNKNADKTGEGFIFQTWLELISWSTRLVMTMFMLGAAFVYSRLWNIYREEQVTMTPVSFNDHGQYLRRECLQYMTLPISAVAMWLLLLLAATLDDDMFWDALV